MTQIYAPDRIVSKLAQGKIVIGTSVHDSGPELLELYAFTGLDFGFFDMMFTTIDWERAAFLIASARAAGITGVPRVATYPFAVAGVDRTMISNIARAMAIGAGVVWYSPSCVEEIRIATRVGETEEHRKIHIPPIGSVQETLRRLGGAALVMPVIESDETINSIDEILEIPDLKVLGLAMGDVSRLLGYPLQHAHPTVDAWVDRTIAKAKARGVAICMNTGYHADPDWHVQRIKDLVDRGVQMIFLSQGIHILERALLRITDTLHAEIPNF